jgi:hypothetical protein
MASAASQVFPSRQSRSDRSCGWWSRRPDGSTGQAEPGTWSAQIVILGLMILLATLVIGGPVSTSSPTAKRMRQATCGSSDPLHAKTLRFQNPGRLAAGPPWEFGPGDLMRRVGRGGGLP